MNRVQKLSLLAVLVFLLSVGSPSLAQNCSSPPLGFGNEWWERYADWCKACCGSPDRGTTTCHPGPNWGCNRGNDSVPMRRELSRLLFEDYKNAYSQLDRAVSLKLPDRVETRDLDDLSQAVLRLRLIAQEEVDRLNNEKADLEGHLSDLKDQIEADTAKKSELSEQISGLEREIGLLEQEMREIEVKIRLRQDLLNRLSTVTAEMDAEAVSLRAHVFDTLREAESRHLIAPPSAYRSLPSPDEPKYRAHYSQSSAQVERAIVPTPQRRYGEFQRRLDPRREFTTPRVSHPLRIAGQATEASVKNEISRIKNLARQIGPLKEEIKNLKAALVEPEQRASELSNSIQNLSSRSESLELRKGLLAEKREESKTTMSEIAAQFVTQLDEALRKWIERSFWKHADETAEQLLKQAGSEASAQSFKVFRKVMMDVVEFRSDIFNIIRRTPEAEIRNNWGDLEVELERSINKFKLNLFFDYTQLPKWAQKLIPKGSLPWREADNSS